MKILDLHRLRYEEAEREIIHFIEDCWGSGEDEAKVITGHSSQMRKLVVDIVKEYDAKTAVGGAVGIDDTFVMIYF